MQFSKELIPIYFILTCLRAFKECFIPPRWALEVGLPLGWGEWRRGSGLAGGWGPRVARPLAAPRFLSWAPPPCSLEAPVDLHFTEEGWFGHKSDEVGPGG